MPALARVLIIHDHSNEIIIRDPLNLIINIESINTNSNSNLEEKLMGRWSYYKVPKEFLSPFAILSSARRVS